MPHFAYQVPETVHYSTELPVKDERGKTLFLLQKRPHKFLASIANETLRGGVPFTYKISNANGAVLYRIGCWFPGIRYEITDYSSSQTVPISSQRVQLTEKSYSFKLSSDNYCCEKDYTGTGHLTCNGEKIAIVSMPSSTTTSAIDTINIAALTEGIAALSAVLFHTFYYYNA